MRSSLAILALALLALIFTSFSVSVTCAAASAKENSIAVSNAVIKNILFKPVNLFIEIKIAGTYAHSKGTFPAAVAAIYRNCSLLHKTFGVADIYIIG